MPAVAAPEKTQLYRAKGGTPNDFAESRHGDRINLWRYGLKEKPDARAAGK